MEWLDVASTWIVTDGWQFIVSILAGTGAAKLFVDYSFKKRLEKDKQVLNKELENHKKELNIELESHKQALSVMTENSKFEYQRMMYDFSLYRTKKHEIYPELFKLIVTGYYSFARLLDDWKIPEFSNYSKDMMEKYLLSRGVVIEEAHEFLLSYESIDSRNVKLRIKHLDWNISFNHLTSLNHYFHQTQLYLSDTLTDAVNLHIKVCNWILSTFIPPMIANTEKLEVDKESLQFHLNQLRQRINELSEQFKKELSIADYVNEKGTK
ncbi:hypothetical protein ACWGPW_14795 [Paenibacillus chitinolyticus]